MLVCFWCCKAGMADAFLFALHTFQPAFGFSQQSVGVTVGVRKHKECLSIFVDVCFVVEWLQGQRCTSTGWLVSVFFETNCTLCV